MGYTLEEIIALAKECGFTTAGFLEPKNIELKEEVRAMCSSGKCGAYNNNWTCPPECGELSECRERISKYTEGIIVQTTGELEDSMDYETMMETGKQHKKNFAVLIEKLRKVYPDLLGLAAGGCSVCDKCAYPEPCRFPEKAFSSMEAYGMVVSDVCKSNDMEYYYGPNTITYVGCYLLK